MALNQQKHAAPRQWHGKGSEGQVPSQQQHAAPTAKKRRGMVDPGPKAVDKELYDPADMRPHTKRLQCGALSGAGSRRLLPSWRKSDNKIGAPTHPTVAQKPQDGRRELLFQMQKAKQ